MLNEISKNLWSILRHATPDEWAEGAAARRALRELCEANQCCGAALEVFGRAGNDGPRGWHRVVSVGNPAAEGDDHLEETLSSTVRLALWSRPGARNVDDAAATVPGEEANPTGLSRNLGVALSVGAQLVDLAQRLKAQSFQDNYRLVTLEALYDVGLAIASTLELDELTDGILLRAVSLLDARRGALYLLRDDVYALEGTIGGDAESEIAADDEGLRAIQANQSVSLQDLLPGAQHSLVVPIAIDGVPRGLLALADKESRAGIGPFAADDERALSLFANQAAIALENAKLHQTALETERLEREMELAAEIQRGILPSSTPDLEDFELIGWNRPTRHVGGDYYGWLELPDGKTGIVVADVTGKGMPAALLVNTLHSALDLLLDTLSADVSMVERLNSHVVDSSRSNKFITMIMMTLESDSSAAGFINAGHNQGLVICADGGVREIAASGLPLGLLPGSSYQQETLELRSGDLVCLYSDGITECADRQDNEYGMERLTEFLEARRTDPLERILAELDQEVTAFADGAYQQDDQTVVLVRRR